MTCNGWLGELRDAASLLPGATPHCGACAPHTLIAPHRTSGYSLAEGGDEDGGFRAANAPDADIVGGKQVGHDKFAQIFDVVHPATLAKDGGGHVVPESKVDDAEAAHMRPDAIARGLARLRERVRPEKEGVARRGTRTRQQGAE
eukprot:1040863-Prymnesium_polylepis.1